MLRSEPARRLAIALAASLAAFLSATRSPDVGAEQPERVVVADSATAVVVRIQGINDLHGHLEPQDLDGRAVGGVAHLAAALDASSRAHPSVRVSAGDAVGASPLISAHFRDEPAVEALNAMGFDVATVGNHDFDRGPREMRRLSGLARYRMLGANVVNGTNGDPVSAPYEVVERAGQRIGFIGVTTLGTPRWLLPEHAGRLRFMDISDTVNRYAAELRRDGVRAVVVVAHAGGAEIERETRQMVDDVDVIVAGHTHANENERIAGKLVVQALPYGTAFSEIDVAIDRRSGEIVASAARVNRTWNDERAPDTALERLVAHYRERVAPLAGMAAGTLAHAPSRVPGPDGVSELGRMVAEAQRRRARADVAFVNSDWIRSGLPAGALTYADLFEVQPFGNRIIRMQMTGAEVARVLERERTGFDLQWSQLPDPLDPERIYQVAVNEFLAGGGEGYAEFTHGRAQRDVGLDVDALHRYLLSEAR